MCYRVNAFRFKLWLISGNLVIFRWPCCAQQRLKTIFSFAGLDFERIKFTSTFCVGCQPLLCFPMLTLTRDEYTIGWIALFETNWRRSWQCWTTYLDHYLSLVLTTTRTSWVVLAGIMWCSQVFRPAEPERSQQSLWPRIWKVLFHLFDSVCW
jgi:hypothetical protein